MFTTYSIMVSRAYLRARPSVIMGCLYMFLNEAKRTHYLKPNNFFTYIGKFRSAVSIALLMS